ncbi:hypothetical protein [Caloramator sp. Dgby_cultured_2]|uniref:hypothetical protein n=1 Tax=Caloramator sp. Dgby_cultured_2 TaxID=3029174 RepID=UPI00237ED8A1|nr:hypothetical protein [Caloramator sp. Dgby_cultured_2]WDU84239.1 hypothetical protein PWK10_07955 [Caloramator sp. Dgby_cultured_2]
MLPSVKVIKLKRKTDFEQQKYKVLINDNDFSPYVYVVSTSITADSAPLIEVTLKLLTNDFQFIEEK